MFSARAQILVLGLVIAAAAASCHAVGTYSVGGSVSGLAKAGLVLQNNGGDDLALATSGTFAFAHGVLDGFPYQVTILSQPAAQMCTASRTSGTINAASVTSVSVVCSSQAYLVGGTVTGLTGSGLVLQNNAGDDLAIAADGSFEFLTPVADGAGYSVTVLTNPTGEVCSVGQGTGTVNGADVATVAVTCSSQGYTVGGTVSGLAGGTVVLRNNGADDTSISSNGTFAFATPVADGASYAVTVASSPAGMSCAVTNGSGTVSGANVTNVAVACEAVVYTLSISLSGLSSGAVVFQNNGGDDLTFGSNQTQSFATTMAAGTEYDVTVASEPADQLCTFGGTTSGTITEDTTITASCSARTFSVGGMLVNATSWATAQLLLTVTDGGAETLSVLGSDIYFTFLMPVAYGATVEVTVFSSPWSQECTITAGGGSRVITNNVSDVVATCVYQYQVSGAVVNLEPANTIELTLSAGGESETGSVLGTPSGSEQFTFAMKIDNDTAYAVTISSQPASPPQVCNVTNGTGTINGGNVTNVLVTCAEP